MSFPALLPFSELMTCVVLISGFFELSSEQAIALAHIRAGIFCGSKASWRARGILVGAFSWLAVISRTANAQPTRTRGAPERRAPGSAGLDRRQRRLRRDSDRKSTRLNSSHLGNSY